MVNTTNNLKTYKLINITKKMLPLNDYDKNDFCEHNPVAHGHSTYIYPKP